MNKTILEMKGICKSFSGIRVLHEVDFTLLKGEVHAIVGQNGAGKSTLMKILNGVFTKDSGVIWIDGREVSYDTPIGARRNGINMIFQEFSLVPTLTVYQNVFLTKEPRMGKMLLKDSYCEKKTAEILSEIGIDVEINPKSLVGELSVGSQQLVEIAKALSSESKILIMDEPTASLTHTEIDSLFDVIKRLKQKGISIIYISHYLRDIFEICDRITVLRDGRRIFTKKLEDTNLEEVISAMVGKPVTQQSHVGKGVINREATPILEVDNLKVGNLIEGISFKLWPGEILGIAGLLGSGRSEIVNAIFGTIKREKGELKVKGERINIRSSRDSIRAGINIVPEDRRKQGLILDFSVKENLILPIVNRLAKLLLVDDKKAEKLVSYYMDKLKIKAEGVWQVVRFLSGGNQQKVVVAKSMASESKILLMDDPTFGIDVQSKQEIMSIVAEFARSGGGVIFISSELDELAKYCHRILVLKRGVITEVVDCEGGRAISEEALLKMIQ
ncbi:MAG: sugar ABC transporter ATP-binding protein [Actinobacteria bacterium]|nr:sugar ABC transporter ATP-binding protein [Actinomycetota bacterium]